MSVSLAPALAQLEASKNAQAVGDYKTALSAALQAFVATPDHIPVQRALVRLLGTTKGYSLPRAVTDHLAQSALANGLDLQALATVVAEQMRGASAVDTVIAALEAEGSVRLQMQEQAQAFDTVFTDKLLLLVLDQATAISPEIERLIKAVRRRALDECLGEPGPDAPLWHTYPEAMAAIANQCFHTEYVFATEQKEQLLLQRLQLQIADNVSGVRVADCITLAMYKPLLMALADLSDQVVSLVDSTVANWPDWATRVWTVQAHNPFLEAKLRDDLHAYTAISPGLSASVQRQYERFPYPRWQVADAPPTKLDLRDMVAQHLPYQDMPLLPAGPVNTLFAGCGTGKQVVQLVRSINMDNVLAVDLSRTSLAYAQRKAQEYGLQAVHFGQADILAVRDWEAAFDFVVCTGVLHHMADPQDALQSLLTVSKPGTVMFLALYSERARAHVVAAREFIAAEGLPDTLEGIRVFRDQIRGLPADHPAKPVAENREFYSASGLHDLVFNTHELRFTPLTLAALLNKAGLRFAGFLIDRPEHKHLYQQRFPDDPAMVNLANWDLLEQEIPDLFDRMMQFWCVRADA